MSLNNNGDKRNELFDEYKLAADQEQRIENNIWASSGIIGLGNIISVISSALLTSSIRNILFIGFISVSFTWIWWNMSKRWWDILHTIILRKQHIEQEIGIKIQTYISVRDEVINELEERELRNTIGEKRYKELKECDLRFKKRGVQKALKWIPIFVTVIWLVILGFSISVKGGIQMNISENLIIQIITYIGFVGLGFAVGIIVGGVRRKKIFDEVYKLIDSKYQRNEKS